MSLYTRFTNRRTNGGETTHEVFKQIQFKEPPLPRRLNPQVPRDLETVCLVAMEKDPDRRVQEEDDGTLPELLHAYPGTTARQVEPPLGRRRP